jgi:hypothetical protein
MKFNMIVLYLVSGLAFATDEKECIRKEDRHNLRNV